MIITDISKLAKNVSLIMEQAVSVKALISEVELNNYGIVQSLLRKRSNFHFFIHKVRNAKNAYYQFISNSAEWSDVYSITPFVNTDGFKFEEVLIDVKLKGTLFEYDNSGRNFFSEPVLLDLSIRAYVQENGYAGLSNIFLLNSEQKVLLEFHRKYEDELKRVGAKTIFETKYQEEESFSFFSRIWKNVDKENMTMVRDTTINYFRELGEAHRNIIYSVCCANMWGRYLSHFSDNSYKINEGRIYPYTPNFYDTRHLFYLETAVEDIYTFYERVAYVGYLFLKPMSFEATALSYNKLFGRQAVKKLKLEYPELGDNPHFKWFIDRSRNQHKILSDYRHPLIHYKTANTFIKGSYSVSRTRRAINNSMNGEVELTKLNRKMENILKFVNKELFDCHNAFERVVLLCESLKV